MIAALLWLLGCAPAVHRIAAPPAGSAMEPRAAVDHEARRLYLLGRIYMEQGELDAASEAFAQARRHDRGSPWIAMAQGDVALARGEVSVARERWREATALDPQCGPAWLRLARLARAAGDLPAARQAYAAAVAAGEGWRARAEGVELLLLLDDEAEARVQVRQWVEQGDVPDRAALRARADARLSAGDRQGAWEDLRAYLLDRPEDVHTLDLFLLLGDGLGRPGAAMAVVDEVVRALPADPEVALREAAFYEGIGHPVRFLSAVDRLLRLGPVDDPRLHLDRVQRNLELGRAQAALEALDGLAELVGPDWPQLALYRARALADLGRTDEALALVLAGEARPAEAPMRARLLRDLGRAEQAEALLRRVLQDHPDQPRLAEAALAHAAAVGDAAWGLELAARQSADPEEAWLRALFQEGRDDAAEALLEQRAARGDLEARRDLAAARIPREPAASAAVLREVVAARPDDQRARTLLAGALVEDGLRRADPQVLAEARGLAEALLAARPDDARLLNLLAWSYVEAGQELDRALALATEAVERRPADPHYLDTLAWTLARQGELRRARVLLEEAAALAPDSPEIAAHLVAVRARAVPPGVLAPRSGP